ncbi:uncharacterized protein AB675_6127 [Cyphellophora attinorum]|uniref:Zn(2)-C6 fungal-type domain-containing protein n=1 Tax=Cyphellophora attinorum TaxID=1664694 RepID=A0A0N1HF45_9EURO|nr:uncharacterized protein AB675_6127 [Phialophora attinorum]KPI43690.1 hypothetical protein AB675_6127 [Phialophora attinorum]
MFIDPGPNPEYFSSWGDFGSPTGTTTRPYSPPLTQLPSSYDGFDAPFSAIMSLSTSGSGKQPRTLAPNLTRRSHKKSRAGCYTCKGRKIKCGEQKPKCMNCLTKGLDCIYPAVTDTAPTNSTSTSKGRSRHDGGSTASSATLFRRSHSASPATNPSNHTFNMLDMRFFHHFLTNAYPHLPLGNDHVWVNEIPQFAEAHPYLMHAILSLGASHLSRLTGTDYRKESLTHRGLAISGLNAALSQPSTTTPSSTSGTTVPDVEVNLNTNPPAAVANPQAYGSPDAMLATCYALTFQASYMGGADGLADFITMVRGCALTTAKIKSDDMPTAFNLQPNWHFKVMAPRLASLPRVDSGLCEDGIRGLELILGEVLLVDREHEDGAGVERRDIENWEVGEVEANFCQSLIEVLEALVVSPQGGYLGFAGLYAVWYELPPQQFSTFLSPRNLPSQLLLSYFVALQMLMVPLAVYEWPERAESAKSRVLTGTVEWAEGIFERLAEDDRQRKSKKSARRKPRHREVDEEEEGVDLTWDRYLKWPKRIMGIVTREIRGDLDAVEERRALQRSAMGLVVKDEDRGVNVLKLGLPISPATSEADGDAEDSTGWFEQQTQEEMSMMATINLPLDHSVEASDAMYGYWDDGAGDYDDVIADPGMMTSIGMDNMSAATVTHSMVIPSIMEPIDLDVDMI